MRAARGPLAKCTSHGRLKGAARGAFGPGDWSWSISLDDFREFDPDALIGSPRSLAALRSEGIEGQEVVYRPIDFFEEPGLDPAVVRLRHDFCEARRQDLLALAREARAELVAVSEGAPPKPPPTEKEFIMQRIGGCDFAPCPRTRAFFTHWQHEFNRFNVAASPIASWPPEGESDEEAMWLDGYDSDLYDDLGFSASQMEGSFTDEAAADGDFAEVTTPSRGPQGLRPLSGTSAHFSMPPSNPSSQAGMMQHKMLTQPRSPGAQSVPWSANTASLPDDVTPSLGSSASEPTLRWKLNELLKAPYANHIDEAMVRKTEEILLTQRKTDFLKQKAEHDEKLHTVRQMEVLALSAIDRSLKSESREHHMRRYRSEMHELCEDERTQAFRHYKNISMGPDGVETLFSEEGAQLMSVLVPAMNTKRGAPPKALDVPHLRTTPTGNERSKHWEGQVRQNNIDMAVDDARRKLDLAESRTRVANGRLERLLRDKTLKSMQFAQDKLQARINWRHGYGEVMRKRDAFENGKRDMFLRKQARFEERMQQADTAAGLRREVGELRRIHRLLSSRQRRKKQEHLAWEASQPPEPEQPQRVHVTPPDLTPYYASENSGVQYQPLARQVSGGGSRGSRRGSRDASDGGLFRRQVSDGGGLRP